MEQYFFIVYILSFTVVFGISYFLIKKLYQEYQLYLLFTKNDDMRKLIANDPKRFHITIIYLMTYMTRSNGSNIVQYDKLQLIVRYIIEVCPVEYQVDAIKALKLLTQRYKGSGKNTSYEDIIDVDAFMKGKENCIKKGDTSYKYLHDLHGMRMAEELGNYLSSDDKLYVMYLLFRLSIADGIITTDGRNSEKYMLERLCVSGLKIDKSELENMIYQFSISKDQIWYEQHFENREDRYPSSDLLANIFRVDINYLASLNNKISKTSVLKSVQIVLFVAIVIFFILQFVFNEYNRDLMSNVYPDWIFILGMVLSFCFFMTTFATNPRLESVIVPVLRSKIENKLQRRALIVSTILIPLVIYSLLWSVSNTLFLIGNDIFCFNEPIVKETTITNTFTTVTKSKNSTTVHYHVGFSDMSFKGKLFEFTNKREISLPNRLCLNTLPFISGMWYKSKSNDKVLSNRTVRSSYEYTRAKGKKIKLYFKQGYFGYIIYDGYEMPL